MPARRAPENHAVLRVVRAVGAGVILESVEFSSANRAD